MYLSATKYGGIRSALTHLYRVSVKNMDQGFKKENKRQDGISLEERKKTTSFDVYKTLCNVLHQREG